MNEVFALAPAQWARLRELLDEAAPLQPAAQAAWLARLSERPEDALFVPRLRALLSHQEGLAAGSAVDTLPRVETADFAPAPGGRGGAVPERVGPYRLLRELGRGGMAIVWLAERTDVLQHRQVALKLPYGDWKGDWHSSTFAERLSREREILARLEHPHIARLYDAGIDAGIDAEGQPWLALEYVQGERIDTVAAQRPLAERLRLFLQATRAVAHAHAQLVVHRDLKPANMLVGADGQVKLLDFGIAKLLDDGVAEATELTQRSGRAFTPRYASPEQLRGEPPGTASDIYSLGVVLHELLTGLHPLAPPDAGRAALEHAVLHTEPRAPSERVANRTLARALRGDLDTIVLKALKREAAERYATAAALADDIERHLQQRPVLARPDSLGYRLQRFVRRNRLASGAAALALLSVLGGSGLALWQAQAARAEAERADTVKRFVTGLFEDASPWVGPQRMPTAAELLQRARERLAGAELAQDPLIRLELLTTVGASLLGLQALKDAEPVLAQARSLAAETVAASHPLAVRGRLLELDLLLAQGRVQDLARAVAALQASPPADAAAQAHLLLRAADVANNAGDAQQMERHTRAALALVQQQVAADHPLHIGTRLALANALENQGRHRDSVPHAQAAFEAAERRHAAQPLHPQLSEVRYVYARVLHYAGERERSLPLFEQAVADTAAVFGDHSLRVATMKRALVAPLVAAGRLDDALATIDQALPVLAQQYAPDSEFMAYAHVARGSILSALRRWPQAHADYAAAERALSQRQKADAGYLLHVRSLRAGADARLGRAAASAAELRSILAEQLRRQLNGQWVSAASLAIALRLQGQPQAALAVLQEHGALAKSPDQRQRLLTEQGLSLLALQRPADALQPLQQAWQLAAQQPASQARQELQVALEEARRGASRQERPGGRSRPRRPHA
jgi:eukaryotic-like serine/threonine-protein kinase